LQRSAKLKLDETAKLGSFSSKTGTKHP